MRPAFDSTRQAAAFALLLLILLLLPAVMSKSLLPDREQIYSSIWWANGAFPYIDQQIFTEKGDIDIAFIGPSHIWNAIDTRYVQNKLSGELGRPAIVRTLCWGGSGYDALYFIAQDLLRNRKVHMLVYYDAYSEQNVPNPQSSHWFRWGDNAEDLTGLSLRLQANYYLAAIMGAPRNLLSLFRSNLPTDLRSPKGNYWETRHHAESFVISLGSLVLPMGFGRESNSEHAPFEDYAPTTMASAADACIYSPSTKSEFDFTSDTIPSWQLHFARKFAALASENGCKLVLLHIPAVSDGRDQVIREREFWPEALHLDMSIVGIPPGKFFAGMSDDDILKLYEDPYHMNKNGQRYFTRLITTSLLQVYDSQVTH